MFSILGDNSPISSFPCKPQIPVIPHPQPRDALNPAPPPTPMVAKGIQGLKVAIQPEEDQVPVVAILLASAQVPLEEDQSIQGVMETIQPEEDQIRVEAILLAGAQVPLEANQDGAPIPPAAKKKRERALSPKELFLELEAIRYVVKVNPFPRKAPAIERKTFPFDQKKHGTGNGVRDSLKRIAMYSCDLVGDKREILRISPVTDQNEKHFRKLSSELAGCNAHLDYRLMKLCEVDPDASDRRPSHFYQFLVLKNE